MLTRHRTIILIIKLLIMSELLKLNQVNLTYQTGDESIKVLKDIDLKTLPKINTKLMMNVGSPSSAFLHSFLPNFGVGLAREEFIINNFIKVII